MTDAIPPSSDLENEERLRKWKEERARIAESERQARISEAERQREEKRLVTEKEREQRLALAEQQKLLRAEETRTRNKEKSEKKKRIQVQEAAALLPSAESVDAALINLRVSRRRSKLFSTLLFSTIVVLPTFFSLIYVYKFATPIYQSRSTFSVHKGDTSTGSGLQSILGSGASGSRVHDAFMAVEFIKSRAMAAKMEELHQVVEHFSKNEVDEWNRSRVLPIFGIDKHSNFMDRVQVAVDVQQGFVTLSIQALDPQKSVVYANEMLKLTKAKVNELSEAIFNEQVRLMRTDADEAQVELETARLKLTALQIKFEEISPKATAEGVYKSIQESETRIKEAERLLKVQLSSSAQNNPNSKRLSREVSVMKEQLAAQRRRLTEGSENAQALNNILRNFEAATIEIDVAKQKWEVSLQALENAKKNALREQRYISVIAPPLAPELPNKSKGIRNVVFLFLFLSILFFALSVFRTTARIRAS